MQGQNKYCCPEDACSSPPLCTATVSPNEYRTQIQWKNNLRAVDWIFSQKTKCCLKTNPLSDRDPDSIQDYILCVPCIAMSPTATCPLHSTKYIAALSVNDDLFCLFRVATERFEQIPILLFRSRSANAWPVFFCAPDQREEVATLNSSAKEDHRVNDSVRSRSEIAPCSQRLAPCVAFQR